MLFESAGHSEKFMAARPRSTSPPIRLAAGSTRLYQGHFVWFEWQSAQERSSVLETPGGGARTALIVCDGSTGGFTRGDRIAKAPSPMMTMTTAME